MTPEKIRHKIFYKQPYYKDDWGGYYIHFHGRDIGKIQKWVNYGDISQEFIAQKQSINMALKNQYTNLMLGNMTIPQKSLGILNELLKKDSRSMARLGKITTPHSVIDTPCFMPVGTQATVKALSKEEIEATGAQMICVA